MQQNVIHRFDVFRKQAHDALHLVRPYDASDGFRLTRKGSKFTDLRNASCMTNQRESWPPQCLTGFVRYPTKLVACLRRKEFFHLLLAIQSSRERLSLPVVKSGNEVLRLASYFKLS
jgi:hypothetical protein